MKKVIILFFGILLIGCSSNTSKEKNIVQQTSSEFASKKSVEKYEIIYDKTKISDFSVERKEDMSMKALVKKLSEYTTVEIEKLPTNKKLGYSIVVPTEISRESLENTLKYFVYNKTEEDKDIDEIIVFVYDNKNDIGKLRLNSILMC